jgi:hypothetical protein
VLRTFKNARLRALVAALVLAGAGVRFLLSLREALPNMTDYRVYFLPYATRAWNGFVPYKILVVGDGSHFASPLDGSNYPPTFLFLMWPWTVLPDLAGRLLWIAGEVACLGVMMWVVARSLGGFTRTQLMLAGALVMLFPPVRDTVNEGQVSILLGALVVLAVGAAESGRGGWGGIPLGIAVGIKLTPVLLLPYFAWRRQWSLVVVTAATSAALVALTLVAGWGAYWTPFVAVLQQISQGTANVLNQSLNGVLLRAYDAGLSGYPIPTPPLAFRVALLLAQVLLATAMALFVLGGRIERREQTWVNVAVIMLALPLAQPFAWPHHFAQATVMLPVVVALGARGRLPAAALAACAVAYLAVLLLGFPLFAQARGLTGRQLMTNPAASLGASLQFYAVVVTCVAMLWLRPPPQREAPP